MRADLTFVESTLKELSEQNKLEYIVVDTADMTDDELTELYIKHHYHQFGTSIRQEQFLELIVVADVFLAKNNLYFC